MPLPTLPPIDNTVYRRYELQRQSSRDLLERARAIPPPAYRGPVAPAAAPTALPAPATPSAAVEPQGRPAGGFTSADIPNQFQSGLSMSEAMAACGPAAAIAFTRRTGRTPTVAEAVQIARTQKLWDPATGMHGAGSQQALLTQLGVPTKLEPTVDWAKVRADVEGGNPVIIDTPGHYYVAAGFDPATGKFDFGASGTALKAGKQWMTPAELGATGMGQARSALYLDNPDPQTAPSVVATQPPQQLTPVNPAQPQAQYAGTDEGQAAQKYGLDPDIFFRQISQESGGRANAVSPAGARGIGQFMPATAASVAAQMGGGITAEQIMSDRNVGLDAAAFHMRQMVDQYGGDYAKALAAYNAGPGAVAKYGGVPPFAETQAYVTKILGDSQPQAQPLAQPGVTNEPLAPDVPNVAPNVAPPRTYGTPQEQIADLMTRYGSGVPAADFAQGAQQQINDLAARYGLPAQQPQALPPQPAVPDYQALADQQIAQTQAARAAAAPAAVPEPMPMPEPVPPEAPVPEPGPLPGETPLDRQFGAIPPQQPYVDPRAAFVGAGGLAPEYTPPPPSPEPVPVPEPYVDPRAQMGLGAGGLTPSVPPPEAAPPPPPSEPPHPMQRAASALQDAGRALGEAFSGFGTQVATPGTAPNTVARVVNPGSFTPEGTPTGGDLTAYGQQVNAVGQQLEAEAQNPINAVIGNVTQGVGTPDSAAMADVARATFGQVGRASGERVGGETGGNIGEALGTAVFPIPGFGGKKRAVEEIAGLAGREIEGAAARAVSGGAPRVAERAAEVVAPAAERVAGLARPVAQSTVEEATARLSAAAGEAPAIARPGGVVLPAEAAAERVAAGAPAVPPRVPPVAVGAAESAGREFAGNIRLGKYAEDVQPIIAATYDEAPAAFEAARRGRVTDETVRELASLAGADKEKVAQRWKPGVAGNAETILALRETMGAQAGKVLEAQQAARALDSSENLGRLTEELTKYRALQETVSGLTAEAGRALRQFRLHVAGEEPNAQLARVFKIAGQDNVDAARQLLLTTDMSDPLAVAKAARSLYQPTKWDRVRALWMNSLLSGPTGRIRDFISSAYSVGTAPLERGAAVPIDIGITAGRQAVQRLRGQPVTAARTIYASEIPAEYVGMASAFNDSFRDSMHMIGHGFTPGQAARGDLEAIARREVLPGALNLPGRLVGANDVFFKGLSSGGSIRAQAINQAKAAGLKGDAFASRVAELVRNPTDAMLAEAENIAKYRSFQAPSELAQKFAQFKNTPGPIGVVATAVMPFHSTAIALAKYAMERSPVGLAMLGLDAKAGRLTQRGLSEGLARVGLGSALLYEGWQLAQNDQLTGAAPKDARERDAFYRQGKAPYSIKLGDNWVSYQGAPFAPILASAVAARDAVRNGQSDTAAAVWSSAALAAGQSMLDQGFMTGVQQLSEALNDPTRFGPAYAESWGRAVVPQAIQTMARANDNIIRDPDGSIEAALAGVPGLSSTLPARHGAFGEPATRPESQQGLQALNPFRPTPVKNDPVETELARLQQVGKGRGFTVEPGMVGKKVGLGQGLPDVDLTREEWAQQAQTAGKLAYGILSQMVTAPGWAETDDAVKAKIISDVIEQTRKSTRETLKPQLIPRGVEEFKKQQSGAA